MAETTSDLRIDRENAVDQLIGEFLAREDMKGRLDGVVKRFLRECGVDVDELGATVDDPTSCDDDFVSISYAADCATVRISTASSASNQDCLVLLQSAKFPNGVRIDNRGDSILIIVPAELLVGEALEGVEARESGSVGLGRRIEELRNNLSSEMEEMGRLVGSYLGVCGGVCLGSDLKLFDSFELNKDSVIVYMSEVQLQQLIAGSAARSLEVLRIEREGSCSVRIPLVVIDKALGLEQGGASGGSEADEGDGDSDAVGQIRDESSGDIREKIGRALAAAQGDRIQTSTGTLSALATSGPKDGGKSGRVLAGDGAGNGRKFRI